MSSAPKIDVRDLRSVRKAALSPDLVLGEDPGSKYDQAQKRGVPTISESDLRALIEEKSA